MSDNNLAQEELLDVTGLACPLPVLKARKRLAALPAGAILRVVASDPMSMIDMAHFCGEQGHTLLLQEQRGQHFHFRIRRK